MEKVILFGCGSLGVNTYHKLKNRYHIQAFIDNDKNKWGKQVEGLEVISVDTLPEYKDKYKIIIASTYYREILEQLLNMNVNNIAYITPDNHFLKEYTDEYKFQWFIRENEIIEDYKMQIHKILFVQDTQCIRTYKIANSLKQIGIQVDLAYLIQSPQIGSLNNSLPYTKIIPINNIKEFLSYVNESNYDIIHCSNEPDYLTNLLLRTNKAVVHDCHDMTSFERDVTNAEFVLEYIANSYSDGNIYITEKQRAYAYENLNISDKPTLLLKNYTSIQQKPKNYLPKISDQDQELHCVYEGWLEKELTHTRYLEEKFLAVASKNIHVHFYTSDKKQYYQELEAKSNYIHWEGNCPTSKLIEEMTQYDVGLMLFNITKENKKSMESAWPNKVFEYLNAGLPIAFDNLPLIKEFNKEYKIGRTLDFQGDVLNQIQMIKNMYVSKDFLDKNKLFMEFKTNKILEFYTQVILQKIAKRS